MLEERYIDTILMLKNENWGLQFGVKNIKKIKLKPKFWCCKNNCKKKYKVWQWKKKTGDEILMLENNEGKSHFGVENKIEVERFTWKIKLRTTFSRSKYKWDSNFNVEKKNLRSNFDIGKWKLRIKLKI